MRPRPKLEVIAPSLRHGDPFHEDHLRQDLEVLAEAGGLFGAYIERARVRFRKASERAILDQWVQFYQKGETLIAAKTAMERRRSEYLQLAREHEMRDIEKSASLAKFHADLEEHNLRRDKAAYQREHLEHFIEGGRTSGASESERKLIEADERRRLDTKWEVQESLRILQTLIELQHWRRSQRDQILQDRSLTSQEQSDDLQFVDELYEQKRADLKADSRIFEERQ